MEKYLLGIDMGTGSIKVVIVDEHANIVALENREYEIKCPHENHAEIDTDCLWDTFLLCMRSMLLEKGIDGSRIKGIGISCLCPGLTAFDEDNKVLFDPILYTDRRSKDEAAYIRQAVGEDKLFGITANGAMPGAISGTSMLWIKNHRPEVYEKVRYFGHMNTLMGLKLTGEVAIDYSNASYTALFETAGDKVWSQELCAKIGIDIEKLPPLKNSTDVIGGLIEEELIKLGIPKGTPVVIGGADTACAALTCGVIHHDDAFESAGTTNVLTICTEKPVFDRRFINRCHVVEGKWIYQGAMSSTGSSLRWAREQLCKDLKEKALKSGESVYTLMGEEAASAQAGAGGIVFLPYMAGERCPIWDPYSKGVFFGITLESERKDLIRAIMEGCGYGLKQLCEIAENLTGTSYKKFISVGGGAKGDVWAQIKADITGKRIITMDMNDAAVMGAALLAGIGIGIYRDFEDATSRVSRKICKIFEPNPENAAVYEKRYQVYTGLYPRIRDLYQIE